MVKIGIFSFAHMHARSYAEAVRKNPYTELVGIADEDILRGEEMAALYCTKFYPSYETLLEDVDAVIITSENSKHLELTIMAAQAGRDILCEKPISTNVSDAMSMIEICRDYNVRLQTAFPMRFSPPIQRAYNIIQGGDYGKILVIKGTNRGKNPDSWFTDIGLAGGGCVIDHTVHVADLMRWFSGAEPVEVYAEIGNLFKHQEYDDTGILSIKFDNGMVATLDTSWSVPESYPTWGDVTMKLICQNGTMDVDAFAQDTALYSDKDMKVSWNYWGLSPDYYLIASFVDAIRLKTPVPVTGYDGLKALEVALAAYKSSQLKKPVGISLR